MSKNLKTENKAGNNAMPADLKVKNRMSVLSVFRSGQEYTAAEIAAQTGISRQTVMKAISFFVEKGLLASIGKGASTEIGGKKPDLYTFTFNPPLISITMWPNNLVITLSNMQGQQLGFVRIDTAIPASPKKAFAAVEQHLHKLLQAHGFTIQQVYGATLSIAGTVNYQQGLLKYSSQMPTWGNDVPLRSYLQNIFDAHTILLIENAGKMAGRAAMQEPAYINKRILVVFSTWGLSACLIEKGHIVNGQNSLVGEIGHMVLNPQDTEQCGCGSYGCLERLVSNRRIQSMLAANTDGYQQSCFAGRAVQQITLADLFTASRQKDALAREVVDYLASMFALALRNISLTFDPDLVLFQGNYASSDAYFRAQVQKHLLQFQYFPKSGPFEIKYDARPLFDLDVIGSVAYLQNCFFKQASLYKDNTGQN